MEMGNGEIDSREEREGPVEEKQQKNQQSKIFKPSLHTYAAQSMFFLNCISEQPYFIGGKGGGKKKNYRIITYLV